MLDLRWRIPQQWAIDLDLALDLALDMALDLILDLALYPVFSSLVRRQLRI